MNSGDMGGSALPQGEPANAPSRRSAAPRPGGSPRSARCLHQRDAIEEGGSTGDRLAAFVGVRSRLLRIAGRIVGSVADAEDVVQDAWLRWDAVDVTAVRDPAAFLATTTRRLAINRTRSSHARLEVGSGTFSPEPVAPAVDGTAGGEAREAVDLALLLLSRRLSPAERAAYLLREVFNYEYGEIAEIIRVSEVNSRQLVARGRKHLAGGHRAPVGRIDRRPLLRAFAGAARNGDLAGLEALLASDVSPRESPAATAA
jgi:RNA polymerase sigma-70 factor (ECF subfamily)